MEWWLPLIWAGIIGLAVAFYVILDGFDLGVGILFPFARDDRQRDQMLASIAPFWDGNETWLVLGGGGLLAAFPRAYAAIMPALYLPVIVMLLALVFRGITFEFRSVARRKHRWDFVFAVSSTLAAFSQGVILGGLIEGIRTENGAFMGGPLEWATPFGFVCGLGVTVGYGLLGATWLFMKAEGELAHRAGEQARMLLAGVLIFMAVVSIWTPLAFPRIFARWFSFPNILFLWPIPIVTAATAFLAWKWLGEGPSPYPFVAAIVLFILGYAGLVISTFPYLVPPSLTVWDTAAAPESQIFLLVGTVILVPIILGYTAMVYWIFRGRVREGESYH